MGYQRLDLLRYAKRRKTRADRHNRCLVTPYDVVNTDFGSLPEFICIHEAIRRYDVYQVEFRTVPFGFSRFSSSDIQMLEYLPGIARHYLSVEPFCKCNCDRCFTYGGRSEDG